MRFQSSEYNKMPSEREPTALSRKYVMLLYLPTIFLYIAYGMLVLMVPLYVAKLEYSFALIGIALSVIGLGQLIMDVPTGWLINRLGVKQTGLLSFLICTLSLIALALYITLLTLIMWTFVFGLGLAIWLVARQYIMAVDVAYGVRGHVSAYTGASVRLGLLIGPLIAGSLIVTSEYATGTAIASGFSLFALALFAKYSRLIPSHVVKGNGDMNTSPRSGEQISYRMLAVPLVVASVVTLVRQAKYYLIPVLGKLVYGADSEAIGIILASLGMLDLLFAYPAGIIIDTAGRRFALTVSSVIIGVGLIMLSISSSFLWFVFASLVVGVGNGLGAGTMLTLGSDIASSYGSRGASWMLGFWRMAGDFGSFIGPVTLGVVSAGIGPFYASGAAAFFSFSTLILLWVGRAYFTEYDSKAMETSRLAE